MVGSNYVMKRVLLAAGLLIGCGPDAGDPTTTTVVEIGSTGGSTTGGSSSSPSSDESTGGSTTGGSSSSPSSDESTGGSTSSTGEPTCSHVPLDKDAYPDTWNCSWVCDSEGLDCVGNCYTQFVDVCQCEACPGNECDDTIPYLDEASCFEACTACEQMADGGWYCLC